VDTDAERRDQDVYVHGRYWLYDSTAIVEPCGAHDSGERIGYYSNPLYIA